MAAKVITRTLSGTGGYTTYIPKHNLTATTDPGAGDDDADGYVPGSEWVNVTANTFYKCTDNATGAAVWVGPLTAGTSYTDEEAQDAVGTILADSTRVNLTYTDATPEITADLIANTITAGYLGASATDVLFGRSTAGAGAGEEIPCTAAGRALLDDADAAAQRTTLGLGTAAVLASDTDATLATGANLPTASAVKSYVDNYITGLSWKTSVRCATTATTGFTTDLEAGKALDGITLSTGDRILVKDQTGGVQNGIYTVNASGAPTRADDASTGTELRGSTVFVRSGTVNADTQWTCTNDLITLGVSSVDWAQVSGAGTYSAGAGLSLTGNQFAVADDAVTNAKLANVATATIKGRTTAGTGDPEDLTPAQARGVMEITRAATDYICLRDEKSSGTDGGGFTSGADQTRTLNTEAADTGNHCTLASNQFALLAGTYQIYARAPANMVNGHKAMLYNVTDGAEQTGTRGGSEFANSGARYASTASVVTGRFTIASTKTFEIRHRCATTRATDGFGFGVGFGTEVYTVVELWREAG